MLKSPFSLTFQCIRRLLPGLVCSLVSAAALADPSARVGRIAYLDGDVQFRASEQADLAQASVNWPLTGGNRITTAPNARAEIRIGSSVIRLDGQSELLMTAIDDHRLALYLPYGSATVRVRNAEVAHEFSLQTPQGQVTLLQPSRLRIDAGRNAPTTSLRVIDGAARFDTLPSSQDGQPGLIVTAGARLDSNNGFSQITSLRTPAANDDFDGWSLARDRNEDRAQSVRYVSTETTGYEELDRNGIWRTTVEYGPVWTPTVVAADWAPYRYGRWLWVAPWGWTWVDNAAWGYAPSHYGRWVSIDNRWCWTPGAVVAQPVWAPAVVGWQVGINFTHTSWSQGPPTTGWFPLAPREVYMPSYAVSRNYVERVNITHITNVTQINNFYRSRGDDRDHAHYRYRALASNVTPTAAPIQVPGRGYLDGQRLTGPGEAMHHRQQTSMLRAIPPQALKPALRDQPDHVGRQGQFMQPAPERSPAPTAPIPPPDQAHAHAHSRSHLHAVAFAPAPAPMPVPVHATPMKAMAISPTGSPPPAERHPHQAGRDHQAGQRATAPVVSAPFPPASAGRAQPPHPAAAPAAAPRQPAHHVHNEHPEGREPQGHRDARERRER